MPLSGVVVVDASRMLPGAVLARQLLDLGARVIKVEEPGLGDLMRHVPPLAGGIGVGFHAFYHGAESVTLDLASEGGSAALRALARRADVVVESFRPGTLERWGLAPDALLEENAALVLCSLSSFGAAAPCATQVGHDLNFVAASGLLSLLPGGGDAIPGAQLADVTAGLLACSSVLAALLRRARTGRGGRIEQPLVTGPVPFMTWAWAAHAAGGSAPAVLSGAAPSYRTYRCADGLALAVGALEPKFWLGVLELVGLPELAGDGWDTAEHGAAAARAVGARFAERPRAHWLALARERRLPLSAVDDVAAAVREPCHAARLERIAVAGGEPLEVPGPVLSPVSPARRGGSAPALGADSARVLAEAGLDDAAVARALAG